MKRPFHLTRIPLSHDTVECLELLLNEAKQGKVLGLAYAAMLSNREFITDSTGECRRNPVFARGLVASLDDDLKQMVNA